MDAVSKDAMGGELAYAPPRLQMLGSLRELTQTEIPDSGGGGELGPSLLRD
jgi:hypothetical protein